MATVTIIIPTLNEEKHIENLLLDLRQQNSQSDLNVIVVDGQSEDKTIEIVKKYKWVKILQVGRGVGRQRTQGGNHAGGEILIFLDADTRLPHQFINQTLAHFQKSNAAIACPMYLPYKSNAAINLIYILFNTLFYVFQRVSPSGAGSCIIVRKEVFRKYGGFKHDLTYDDIEFIRRISKREKFIIIPKKIYVSDRRFRKQGTLKTFGLYLVLSFFFTFGLFRQANRIKYLFGNY